MQLIVDAAATIDIENMSTINEESLNEKFSTKIIENFANELNNVEEVNDRVSGFVETTKESFKFEEIDKKFEDNKIAAITTDLETGEEQKRDDVIDKDIGLDYSSDLNNSVLPINEVNVEDSNVNTDKKENEDKELVPKANAENIKVIENVESDHKNVLDNAAIKISNFVEEFKDVNDEVNIEDVSTIDLDDKTNDNVTEIRCENLPENEDSVDILETNKEEQIGQNDNNIIIDDSENQDDVTLISSDIENAIHNISVVLLNTTPKNEENSECEIFSEPKITASQNEVESNKFEDYDKNYVIDIDQMDDVLEPKSPNVEDSAAKIVGDDERDDMKENTTDVKKENVEEIEKLDHKNKEEKKKLSLVSKLSNTLDILSDEEDEKHEEVHNIENPTVTSEEKQCINLVDDDDIMLVDEETSIKNDISKNDTQDQKTLDLNHINKSSDNVLNMDTNDETGIEISTDSMNKTDREVCDKTEDVNIKPLLPSNFLKTCKKNLVEMSRDDLEEFCILKIVESVVDRSSLGDIRTQLKNMALTVEEYKKKALMLTKQNRDLQVVLKSVQEEQKKESVYAITPLKITRSVGMQVFMADKTNTKRKNAPTNTSNSTQNLPLDKPNRNTGNQKPQKNSTQQIPVPRLVPAANTSSNKSNTTQSTSSNTGKSSTNNVTLTNGVKNSPAAQKPEKRARVQSVTVDLTDDEPPSKVSTRGSPVPPVRLVPAQNLLATQRPQFPTNVNSPRKVYIPISGSQAQNIRPGQTIMLKSVSPNTTAPKPRASSNVPKAQPARTNRVQFSRHPAPLPDVMKQYQPPNWKALPPAPDLKLSKVDNGIVISWKIEGYKEDSYEEITSYQLYAYQETQCPPSTALWKKIGDVKALPLPMACTLTQFMTGHKYYFAVRAVDIKSRFGPFSIPGSILLLNTI